MMPQHGLMSIHMYFYVKCGYVSIDIETYNIDVLTALKCNLTYCNMYYVLFFVLICCNMGYVVGCVYDVSVVCVFLSPFVIVHCGINKVVNQN